MGHPACLPDFDGLVEQVAAGTGLTKGDESHDRFLGVLESNGVNVHRRAARKLRNRVAHPTALHSDLVRLAGPSDGTQIVTTNFDTLFEQAAQQDEIRASAYDAPALPMGSSFNGIVHLHGSLDEPMGMVLTDSDVGRAYITEGWARRFLVQLFGSHTVLFVGYSHNDTIPEYLARAMPSMQSQEGNPHSYGRYILTDAQDNERWTRLGITPIGYAKQDYSHLGNSLSRLATHMDRDLVAWDADLARVASAGPHAGQEQLESVRIALRKVDLTRRFGVHALGMQWLGWLDKAGYLGNLFNDGDFSRVDIVLGWWVGIRFIQSDTRSLNELIEDKDGVIHLQFWMMLAGQLGPTRKVVSDGRKRLLQILLAEPPPQVPGLILRIFAEVGMVNNDYRTATKALMLAVQILLGVRRKADAITNFGLLSMSNQVDADDVVACWHHLARARNEIADEALRGICKALEDRVENPLAVSRSSVAPWCLKPPFIWSRNPPTDGLGSGNWPNLSDSDPAAVLRMILRDCLESIRKRVGSALNERVAELADSTSDFLKDVAYEHVLMARDERPVDVINWVASKGEVLVVAEDVFVKFVEREYSQIDEYNRQRALTWIWAARSKPFLDVHKWLDGLASSHRSCQVAQNFARDAHQERLQWSAEPIQNQKEPASSPTSKKVFAKAAASVKSGHRQADAAVESVDATSIDFPEHLVKLKKLLQRHQDLYSRFSVWFHHLETHGTESLQRGAFETELFRSEGFKCVAQDVARIYLAHDENPDLYLFYGAIQELLKGSEPSNVKRIWDDWLGELFRSRCEGVPTPVERIEAWFMFSLMSLLTPSVPNVVDVLTQLPGECNEFLELHRAFKKTDVEAYPEQYARVLVHIGRHNEDPVNWFGMRDHLDTLADHPDLCDELKRQLNGVRLKLGIDQPQ